MKMIKRFTAGVIAVAMALSLMPAFAITVSAADFANAAGGTGTEGDPYQISTADQLKALATEVNNGTDYNGTYFKLTQDIDLSTVCSETSSKSWTPIGTSIGTSSRQFKGTFDGDGHEITGLYIYAKYYQGLFGYVGAGGTVKNLGVEGTVTGDQYVGGVVGYNSGRVESCYNTGAVKSTATQLSYVGGVVGNNFGGTVTNCYNTGTVTGSGNYVGGIVGYNSGFAVTNCYNTGTVTGNRYVGGVAGYNSNNSTVENCYYLNTCVTNGANYGTSKTAADFNSGEVARLLQDAQSSGSGQVWGQALAAEPKDASPVLTSDDAKKVLKVTFNKDDDEAEYRYTNPNGTVTVPTAGAGRTWADNGEEFTSNTPVTADMTVTAVEKFTAEIDDDIVTAEGTGQYAGTTASGFVATITSALNRATITKLSINAGGAVHTPNEELPELTIDSGSGIVIGIIIDGVKITSKEDVTFNIE